MTQRLINTGQADKGNGDPIRTAFTKVNENFAELYSQLAASVVVGATAPTSPEEGSLWWNSESGRMYVYYGTAWVDASPVDGAGINSTNELVNGGNTVSLGSDGALTFPSGILADLGGAEFGTGFSLTTDGDQAIIGASNLISLETSGGYGQLHLSQDTETNKGRVEIFFQNGPGVLWIFDEEDSSLTFPDTTKQTTAWTGITGFGEGFGLTDADKIVTNKLYSTNLTQPTQHYRLELDTNGVVVLPDGSIINGSTIRGVAGTGELNYTGITIGPNSNDAEKTWMWVDHANAYISTNNAANTWTFGNNGSLTLPLGSTLDETPAATTVTIYGAGASAFNQTYTRTYGDPTYPDQYLGSNDCRIFRDSGTANKWRLREVSTDYYESDDLVTWTDFIGGADPAPTGTVSLKTADITVGTNTWAFGADGDLSFPDGTTTSGKGITLPVNQSLTVTVSHDEPPPGHTNTFKVNPESIKLPTGNGTIFSGTETAANAWHLDSANKTLYFPNAGDGVFPQIKYSTTGNDGMQLLTAAKPIKITVESNTHWTFDTDGALTVPSVLWNYTPTTFTSIPTTYGTAQLTFTVLPDNTFTNMSVAVGGGGYGADNQQLTVPGTTFPGGASPANDIVFNVTTFPVLDFPSEITTASIVTYVSGNPPQRYDNIESSGSVGIGANNSHWTFGTNGALTLPDASVIASYKPVTVIAATTTAQTITDNASAAFIQFVDTVDTASAYSPGTFTAPYTGYYQINMSVYFSTAVSLTSTSFLLIDTNLDFTKQVRIIDGNWAGSYLHYSTVISAAAGDAIRVAFRQVSGGDVEISSGSRLTIHRVSIS